MLCNTGVMCYFSVAMKIVYGKLGAIRVVSSQLGFERPFSIRFFCKKCCSNCPRGKWSKIILCISAIILFQCFTLHLSLYLSLSIFRFQTLFSIILFSYNRNSLGEFVRPLVGWSVDHAFFFVFFLDGYREYV